MLREGKKSVNQFNFLHFFSRFLIAALKKILKKRTKSQIKLYFIAHDFSKHRIEKKRQTIILLIFNLKIICYFFYNKINIKMKRLLIFIN